MSRIATGIAASWPPERNTWFIPSARHAAGQLRSAGFRVTGRHLIPLFNPRHEQNTFSGLSMEMIGRLVVGRQGLTDAVVDAWLADLREARRSGRLPVQRQPVLLRRRRGMNTARRRRPSRRP
jgi:hypothetical protein